MKVETPPKNSIKEDLSSITNPENISDGEDESKFCESIKLKIEEMKTESCTLKEFLPILNKSTHPSPILKWQSKIVQKHQFRNLIFNPNCPKETFREHLKIVYKAWYMGSIT